MSLKQRLLKLKMGTTALTDSSIYQNEVFYDTGIPMLNVALSGKMGGGMSTGSTVFAGPSKHFKTLFGLLCVLAYLKAHKDEDPVCHFSDSERGASKSYFESLGVVPEFEDNIIHTLIESVEKLKFEAVNVADQVEKGKDRLIFFIDSLGNVASKKEVQDALDQNSAADMTRAKEIKSFFRSIAGYLNSREIPLVAICHTYSTMEMYSKQKVSGGTGIEYNANNIIIVGRRQRKATKTESAGYDFVLNIEKSRFVKEGAQIPITVTFDGGINRYSGLLEEAIEGGYVIQSGAWYNRAHIKDDTNRRKSETNNKEFWDSIFNETDFQEYVESKYRLGGKLISDSDSFHEGDSEE